MSDLIAIDWGTSSLRGARLAGDGSVLEERAAPQGILHVPAGGFPQVFRDLFGDWLGDASTLALMSGMVGSRQGWHEAAYCPCPAGFSELAGQVLAVPDAGVAARVAIVPGMSCERDGVPDVMRGEEVQVFGAMALLGVEDGTFVLPGTHSKWVRVAQGRIRSFTTFMTGEAYGLLRRHSILARTMAQEDGELAEPAFLQGVDQASRCGSLLDAAFSARTLALFDRLAPDAAPSYLSGLLIGEELRAQARPGGPPVVLIGQEALTHRYALALARLGVQSTPFGAQATWRGLRALAGSVR